MIRSKRTPFRGSISEYHVSSPFTLAFSRSFLTLITTSRSLWHVSSDYRLEAALIEKFSLIEVCSEHSSDEGGEGKPLLSRFLL